MAENKTQVTEASVEHSVWIAAPRKTVWRALTEPIQLERWYARGCPWEIPSLQVGATVKFYNTDTDIQYARIEVVEPPQRWSLRWQIDPTSPDLTLINTFLLEEETGGTRVTVIQAGYEALPEALRQKQIDEDARAYTAIMESLKAHLES